MIQGALAGLAVGGVYALTAVCLTLMARLVRVINFAQVAIGMFGVTVVMNESQRIRKFGFKPPRDRIQGVGLWITWAELKQSFMPYVRGSFLGFGTGVLPGLGGMTATLPLAVCGMRGRQRYVGRDDVTVMGHRRPSNRVWLAETPQLASWDRAGSPRSSPLSRGRSCSSRWLSPTSPCHSW